MNATRQQLLEQPHNNDNNMNLIRIHLSNLSMGGGNTNVIDSGTLKLLRGENLTPSWFFNKVTEHGVKYETQIEEKHLKRMATSPNKYAKTERKTSAVMLCDCSTKCHDCSTKFLKSLISSEPNFATEIESIAERVFTIHMNQDMN